MQSPYIPLPSVVPDWLIREAEEILENNIRGPQERQKKTEIPCKGSTTKFHCTLSMRTEIFLKNIKKQRSRKSGENEEWHE